MEEIHLKFTISDTELMEGAQAASNRTSSGAAHFYLSLLLLSVVAAALFDLELFVWGDLCLIAIAAIALNAYWWAPKRAIRNFRASTPGANSEKVVIINDQGLSSANQFVQSKILWEGFNRFRETKNLILLFRGSHSISLPKRAMEGEQLTAIRALLTKKFPPLKPHASRPLEG